MFCVCSFSLSAKCSVAADVYMLCVLQLSSDQVWCQPCFFKQKHAYKTKLFALKACINAHTRIHTHAHTLVGSSPTSSHATSTPGTWRRPRSMQVCVCSLKVFLLLLGNTCDICVLKPFHHFAFDQTTQSLSHTQSWPRRRA